MKIDLTELKRGHWFEDTDGNVYDAMSDKLPKGIDYFVYKSVFPCEYKEDITVFTYHPEHRNEENSFYQAMLHFRWFYKWMQKRMKKRGDNKTFKLIGSCNTTYNDGELILAMCNSGDYTLEEAIYIHTHSCERCLNVLSYKYLDKKDGYAEHSEEWEKCNTVCKFCENE